MITSIEQSKKLKDLGVIYPTKLLYNFKAYKLMPYYNTLNAYKMSECLNAFNAQEIIECFPRFIKKGTRKFKFTKTDDSDAISYISLDQKLEIYFLHTAFMSKTRITYYFETLLAILTDIRKETIKECI